MHAAVIQADIGDFDKIAAERGISGASDKVISSYIELTQEALKHDPKPELVIWLETAYPSTFGNPAGYEDLKLERQIEGLVRSTGIPLLLAKDRADGKDFNALFLLPEPAAALGLGLRTYRKNILLLFGEYVPFTENNRFFRRYFLQIGNFGRGIGPDVVQIPIGRLPAARPRSRGRRFGPGRSSASEALFPNT